MGIDAPEVETMGTPPDGGAVAFDVEALAVFGEAGPGVRTLADMPEARVVLFAFRPGQRLPEHHTSSRIWVQALRGDTLFAAGGREVTPRERGLIHLAAGIAHDIVALTEALVLVTMTPSPRRHTLERTVFAGLETGEGGRATPGEAEGGQS